MRKIMEPAFYFLYLAAIGFAGVFLIVRSFQQRKKGEDNHGYLLGIACFLLGFGDAFHLIPRAIGLFTDTLDNPSESLAFYLGVGKLITSVTMTVFYDLLYLYFRKKGLFPASKALDIVATILTALRFALLCFPQNGWTTNATSLDFGIYRNVPFVILGVMVIALSFRFLWHQSPYRFLGIAITLSFLFYIPVVLFAHLSTYVGMLMLPKTVCYLWIAGMFLKEAWPKKA